MRTKITKNTLTILLSIFLCHQYQAAIVYTDIVDQTLSSGGSITINFDGTGVDEFEFLDQGFGGAVEPGVFFNSSDYHLTTVSSSEWDVIKGIPLNTSIGAGGDWFDQGDAYIDPFWGSTLFPSGTDTYIGAQFKLGANTHYGWILVNWDGNGTFIVKSFAYNDVPDASINAGDTGGTVGISDQINSTYHIYPNPFNNVLNLTGLKIGSTAQLIDVTGKTIELIKAFNKNVVITTNHLENGVYFIKISDENSTTTRKLVKN
ncbi:MAG: T9SS type A sorting domain-containing protein [Flavobacteriales bacterium]|nr:T9SS type A sorting domain-containing protein [Flavobacteriales bacterium]